MLSIQPVSDNYHVCAQVSPEDVPGIARAGYTTLICMRPDGEAPGQPAAAEIEAAARANGLAFHVIPVQPGMVTPAQAEKLKGLLDAANGRVLSYCASGNRCAMLWRMATSG